MESTAMTLPNFLLIGAAKAGTTSLQHYLRQHPDIYLSPTKELNFFAYRGQKARFSGRKIWKATTLAQYRAHFGGARGESAIGEVSPRYLRTPGSAERILQHLPRVRLIAILREPAERAYSHYCMRVRSGDETRTFSQAVAEELSLLRRGSNTAIQNQYIADGYYDLQLTGYFDHFAPEQIAVHLYDDLKRDPTRVLADIFRFLGVDDGYRPDTSIRHNAADGSTDRHPPLLLRQTGLSLEIKARLPAWAGLRWSEFTRRFDHRVEPIRQPPMDPQLRESLGAHYRQHIVRLQALIQRDLSAWL